MVDLSRRASLPFALLLASFASAASAQTFTHIDEAAGPSYDVVTLTGTGLDNATAVTAGPFTTSITKATSTTLTFEVLGAGPGAPNVAAGSTVPLKVKFKDGHTLTSAVPFSSPLARATVTGPLPLPNPAVNSGCDTLWVESGYQITGTQQPLSNACSFTLGTTGNGVTWTRTSDLGDATVNSDSPSFHVGLGFRNDSNEYKVQQTGINKVDGTGAYFTVQAYLCTVKSQVLPKNVTNGTVPTGQVCKNWDGNKGTWQPISGASGHKALANVTTGGPSSGDINVNTSKLFDTTHLVRTLLFQIVAAQCASGVPCNSTIAPRTAYSYLTLEVVRSPIARVQVSVLPYAIVYQPPGDQSTSSIQLTDQYNTNFMTTNNNQTSNSYANRDQTNINASMKIDFNLGGGQSWDTTTTNGFGTTAMKQNSQQATTSFSITLGTAADSSLIPGSGATCPSETNCSPLTPDPTAYENEPFWQDNFLLLIHPQFAVWEQLAGQTMTVMTAAVPVLGSISVADLAACAGNAGTTTIPGIDLCTISYADETSTVFGTNTLKYVSSPHTFTLTPAEATNLLKLDPFYGVGQAASLDPTRATQVADLPYGAQANNSPTTAALNVNNTTQSMKTNSGTTQYTTTVTSVIGNTTSGGLDLSLGVASETFSISDTTSSTTTKQTQMSFGDSTAVSSQKASIATGSLSDADSLKGGFAKGHGPLPLKPNAVVFLDRKFGGFMYVDAFAPGPPKGTQINFRPIVVKDLLLRQHGKQPFADVPVANAAHDAIGFVASANWLSPTSATTFSPDAPITRGDFAAMLAKAKSVDGGTSAASYSDVSAANSAAIGGIVKVGYMQPVSGTTFAPDQPLTGSDFSAALGKAFVVNGAPMTGATVTRAQAAQAVVAALEN